MIHKSYNHSHGTYGYFDIGIIKLTEDKKYNTLFVQPICLPEKEENFVEGKAGVITGYAHQNKVRIGRFFHIISTLTEWDTYQARRNGGDYRD